LVIDQAYASFDDYWEPFTKGSGPGGAYVVSLSEDRRQQLEARMRKRLLSDRQDGSFTELGAGAEKFLRPESCPYNLLQWCMRQQLADGVKNREKSRAEKI